MHDPDGSTANDAFDTDVIDADAVDADMVDVDAVDADMVDVDAVDTSSSPPSISGVFGALVAAVRSRPTNELIAIMVPIPALLVGVALLPDSAAWQFSLAAEGVFESPWTFWTAYASSFVHLHTGHLLDNVINYWLLIAVAYPLSVIAGWQRRLLYTMLGCLTFVPLASAWVTLWVLGDLTNAPAAGFSDVNSALLGYLGVVWFVALAADSQRGVDSNIPRSTTQIVPDTGIGTSISPGSSHRVDARWAVVAVFVTLAAVFLIPSGVVYFPPVPAAGALFALSATVVSVALLRTAGRPRIVGLNLGPARELLYATGASVIVASVIGSLLLVPFGSNVYAHLVGYVFGALLALMGVLADG